MAIFVRRQLGGVTAEANALTQRGGTTVPAGLARSAYRWEEEAREANYLQALAQQRFKAPMNVGTPKLGRTELVKYETIIALARHGRPMSQTTSASTLSVWQALKQGNAELAVKERTARRRALIARYAETPSTTQPSVADYMRDRASGITQLGMELALRSRSAKR